MAIWRLNVKSYYKKPLRKQAHTRQKLHQALGDKVLSTTPKTELQEIKYYGYYEIERAMRNHHPGATRTWSTTKT